MAVGGCFAAGGLAVAGVAGVSLMERRLGDFEGMAGTVICSFIGLFEGRAEQGELAGDSVMDTRLICLDDG